MRFYVKYMIEYNIFIKINEACVKKKNRLVLFANVVLINLEAALKGMYKALLSTCCGGKKFPF